jgi:alkylation response protein AidB-like acyl-CoA dehydrogenase
MTATLTPTPIGVELRADTAAGEAMVAAAEAFAAEFADAALAHDRGATFASDHLARLGAAGFLVAPIPATFGGGGVTSVHDLLIAMSRLARGDAATAIGVNMHFSVLGNIVRTWQRATARGATADADATASFLEVIAAADIVFAAAVSEPSPQDLTRPATTATRVDGGWRVDGRKIFATMRRMPRC